MASSSSHISPALAGMLSQFLLPVGLPGMQHPKSGEGLPHALDDLHSGYNTLRLTTLREFTMMRIMNNITDKPDWSTKVSNEEITAKWRAEILADKDLDVTEKMLDYIIEELKWKAGIFKETGIVSAYDGDIVKSDVAVPETLRAELQASAARLEDVPEKAKDWHPGSNGQVLDLVHPSLFPFMYGKTRIVADKELTIDEGLTRSGEGETLPWPGRGHQHKDGRGRSYRDSDSNQYSHAFQWLPCDVKFRPDERSSNNNSDKGENLRCQITSYINNLHPHDHRELYGVVERILDRVIPLWNETLAPLQAYQDRKPRIKYSSVEYTTDPDDIPDDELSKQNDGEDENDYDKRIWDLRTEMAEDLLIMPEPKIFKPRLLTDWETDEDGRGKKVPFKDGLQERFRESGLQVIIKLANIHLTPEKPEYPGGTWHVEGQLNERICATALYYYDSDNITSSHLAFRQLCSYHETDEIGYNQGHDRWLPIIFGVDDRDTTIQNVGSIHCTEGRLLTFPNLFQHQVQPFSLADRSKPGHRKILALFLVDPNVRVLSTANVPVQRKDWWSREVSWGPVLGPLPTELRDMVWDGLDGFPVDMEEAKRIREKLMEERKVFVGDLDKEWEKFEFSLCEH